MGRSKNTEFFGVAVVEVTIAATALIICQLSCKIESITRIMDYKNLSHLRVIAYYLEEEMETKRSNE